MICGCIEPNKDYLLKITDHFKRQMFCHYTEISDFNGLDPDIRISVVWRIESDWGELSSQKVSMRGINKSLDHIQKERQVF